MEITFDVFYTDIAVVIDLQVAYFDTYVIVTL